MRFDIDQGHQLITMRRRLTDESKRPFRNFYMRHAAGNEYSTETHTIRCVHFGPSENGQLYDFVIDSPSAKSKDHTRRYVFPYEDFYDVDQDGSDTAKTQTHICGQIGENIARILVREWLRRLTTPMGMVEPGFVKGNFHPRASAALHRMNTEYVMRFCSRYNFSMMDFGEWDDRDYAPPEPISEFDGIVEYRMRHDFGGKDGVALVEAKTGAIGYLTGSNSVSGRERIQRAIIDPICSLYPNEYKDLIIVGTDQVLFKRPKQRILKPSLVDLRNYLLEYDIGVVVLSFKEVSKARMMKAAKRIYQERFVPGEEEVARILERSIQEGEKTPTFYVRDNGRLLKVKGRRVELVFENRPNDDGIESWIPAWNALGS